ncbi:TetR/AcrR family transcriptional regulator [Actinocorallia longicatena]|uniref:TetR/AcrR family transcriptional regulator n=1 Tax=Actinocorallia longicatena TaxID=111803 RepID=A0ABP6QD12_9ACTN
MTSPARARLLDTATRLFYAEGVHTVGIDRIIAEAGVAKATFYKHFPAKDTLVIAYLAKEYARQREALEALPGTGTERVERIFTLLGDLSCGPGFRGCPFLNAAAEFPDPEHPVRLVVADYREWFRGLMRDLLERSGRDDAAAKADLLLLIRDGLAVSGGLGDETAVAAGVRAALVLAA